MPGGDLGRRPRERVFGYGAPASQALEIQGRFRGSGTVLALFSRGLRRAGLRPRMTPRPSRPVFPPLLRQNLDSRFSLPKAGACVKRN